MTEETRSPAELARLFRWLLEIEAGMGSDPAIAPAVSAPVTPRVAPRVRVEEPATVSPSSVSPGAPAGRASPARAPSDEVGRAAERHRREALLAPLREEAEACRRCRLGAQRTQAVFGVGDPLARLMFVGEAPGFDEDRRGEPFVGRAGELLDAIIRAMRLEREQVYIANIIKCRPPGNRNPEVDEMASCLPFLDRQIEIIRPEAICALGAVAARALLRSTASVGRLRGRFHDRDGIPVRVTYHPAYLLRNPEDKRKTWTDVQAVMERLGL